MNHAARHNHPADEIAVITGVVSRHLLPDFISGFEVRLGEFGDDPAAWMVFKLIGADPSSEEDLDKRVKDLAALRNTKSEDLLEAVDDRRSRS